MKLKQIDNDERGMISIITTMVIMSLLTLIALGFANLATREQRQALDQQLNTQAFYAAESGVNEAIKNPGSFNSNDCNPGNVGSDNVSYSCVLVNDRLPTIDFSDLDVNGSVIVPITPTSALDELVFSWENTSPGSTYMNSCDHRLLSASDWGDNTGILRVLLAPGGFSNRQQLIDGTQTLFMYPNESTANCNNNSNSFTVPAADDFTKKGAFVDGNCSDPSTGYYKCNASLFIPIAANATYYLRLKPIYKHLNVKVSGKHAGSQVFFTGAQREIDSTGKVADVLRRVQVRVPIWKKGFSEIDYATETTQTMCKRLFVVPGVPANSDVSLDNPAGATQSDVNACNPSL